MQFLAGQKSVEVTNFRGPKQLLQIPNLGPEDAIAAVDCRYLPGTVGSRKGFANAGETSLSSGVDRSIRDMFAWLGANFNRLVMLVGNTALRIRDLATSLEYAVATLTSSDSLSMDIFGGSAYVGTYTYQQVGNQFFQNGVDARIVVQDPVSPATLFADPLWPGPSTPGAPTAASISGAWTPSSIGTGVVTAGVHNFAAIFTTRSGYVFQPLVLDPATRILNAAGGLNYTISFNVAAGLDASFSRLQFAMTPAGEGVGGRYFLIPNPTNNYFVTPAGISGGILQVGISDDDLIATGKNIIEFQQNFFQGQTVQGTAVTLRPYCIRAWQDRMVYVCRIQSSSLPGSQLTESAAFISDAGLPQTISLARSIWQLPGARFITTWQPMRDYSYVFGPNYTYIANYGGSADPVTWQQAQLVDAEIGAPGENCVAANPSKGFVWVANSQGLFLLVGGTYQRKPISWYCTDWQRIDWSAVRDFQLVDIPSEQEIRFYCRLTTPEWGYLVFSYQNGVSPEEVQYTRHLPMSGVQNNFLTRSRMANVHLPSTNRTTLMRTNAKISAGNTIGTFETLKADTDTTVGSDYNPTLNAQQSIFSFYIHAPLPADSIVPMKFNGVSFVVSTPNGGSVEPLVSSKDQTRTQARAVISGQPVNPQTAVTRLFGLQSEGLVVTLVGTGQWLLHKLEVFFGGPLSFRR